MPEFPSPGKQVQLSTKTYKEYECQKTQFEDTEQGSKPDSDMADIVEMSDNELKTTMIRMLSVLMGKVDNMQEEMGNICRQMEILRKNPQGMLVIKITVT